MKEKHDSFSILRAENSQLKKELEALQTTLLQSEAKNKESISSLHGQLKRQEHLNNYASALSNEPESTFYPFIISEITKIFEAESAIISVFNEKTSELEVKYTNLNRTNKSIISRALGKKISELKIPVTPEQYNLITDLPYTVVNSLSELTFGAISETVGRLIERTLHLSWHIGIGLVFNQKLIGTIVLTGNTKQPKPENNEIAAFSGITANVIGRRISEKALYESETQFLQLLNEAPVGFQTLDSKGNITSVNQLWVSILGYKQQEAAGKPFAHFLSPKSAELFNKKIPTILRQGYFSCELEFIHQEGQVIKTEIHFKTGYDINGRANQILCLFKDLRIQQIAEKLASEQEEIYKAVANHIANWESWFDNTGRVIWTNPAAFQYTGYTPDEILAMPDYISTLVAEEDQARIRKELKNIIAGKKGQNLEFICKRKDQSRFTILMTWSHISDKNGKAMGIRTSGYDITLQRKTEEAFTKSESLYKQMVDNAPFGMHFYEINNDNKLIFTGANPAANKILGIDNSKFKGLTIEEAFPSLAKTKIIQHYRKAALNNNTWVSEQIEYTDQRISGAFEVKAFQTIPGKMVAIFTDITKRKKTEEALNESRQLFEALTRVSPVGIFRTDQYGETTYVNPKWMSLTGLNFEDALDSKYLNAIHPDDRFDRIVEWKNAVAEQKPIVSEYRFLRSDGSIVWVQGHAVPEFADNKLKGYIGSITDITNLKQVEAEMVKAKEKAEASNRLKTTFMGNISHEIRTPLNGIIGFAELIRSGDNTPEENDECMEYLSHSINRLTRIIDNIMDVSVMMSGNININKENFKPADVIRDIFNKYEPEALKKKIAFQLQSPEQDAEQTVNSDKSLITRVITELIDNAIKFTTKGKVILKYVFRNNKLQLRISDTGTGVSKEFLPYIFEPFQQEDVYSARTNNSNGLGLSIVQEAVRLLNGTISAESTLGIGTTISVELPVMYIETIEVGKTTRERQTKGSAQPTILVVEDEEINMIYIKRLLLQKNYNVKLASNGSDAISMIEQGAEIDLILMDMKMPGMDGFETTRIIKTIAPEIKIAAVTAYASEADHNSCIEAGCDDYISKPFQKNDLYQLIERNYPKPQQAE